MESRPANMRDFHQRLQPVPRSACPDGAFTLIEMVGVLAVVMILASVVFATTIRQLDQIAGNQESTNLVVYASALQSSILRNRYIPGPSDWAQVIATEAGVNPVTVSTNARRNPRILLIDPQLQIGPGTGALPYSQTSTGSLSAPVSPRLMILSTLGPPLPGALTNGTTTAANFSALWNAAAGTVPPAPAFTGWKGGGTDLKVQRLNLAPLFVHLLLQNYASLNPGGYAIDRMATNSVPSGGVDAYFIQDTILGLVKDTGLLDSEQVLTRDTSMVYAQGVWRGSIAAGPMLTGPSLGLLALQFSQAAYPANTPLAAVPGAVMNSMNTFMSTYNAWAVAGFPGAPSATYTAAYAANLQMRQAMLTLASTLVQGGGGNGDH